MAPPPRGVHPVVGLTAACALVAVILLVVQVAVDSIGSSAPIPVEVMSQPEVPSGGSTPVISLRRGGAELVSRQGFGQLDVALNNFATQIDSRSCVRVAVGDVVSDAGRDTVAIPASSLKVLTAGAAVDVLGEDYRFTTTVRGRSPVDGVVDGDVALVGGGDPLLSGDWYPVSALDRFAVLSPTSLDTLARDLAAAGVRRITGSVVGDASRWPEQRYLDSWADGVAGIEAGPISALVVNDSRVEGGQFRYDDSVEAAVIEFERALSRAGVVVDNGSGSGVGDVVLAEIASAPMTDVVAEMLQTSDNNTAEMLVREIGYVAAGTGTTEAGLETMMGYLSSLGVDTSEFVLLDGSGLAPGNRISCDALLRVLMSAPDSVLDALAVAGVSGTLVDVYADTDWAGRLRAKTGTLGNPPYDADPPAVKALVGELVSGTTDEPVRFALVLNQYQIDDQSRYRPLWADLLAIIDAGPDGVSTADVGPR